MITMMIMEWILSGFAVVFAGAVIMWLLSALLNLVDYFGWDGILGSVAVMFLFGILTFCAHHFLFQ